MNPAELTFFGALILGPLVLGFKRKGGTDSNWLEKQARKRVTTADAFHETLAKLEAQGVVMADTQYHHLRDLFSAMCPMQTYGTPATYSLKPLDSFSVSSSNDLPEEDKSMHFFDPPKRDEEVFLQPMDGTRFISPTDR
ncbi:hypothetical protein N7474_005093 [Penicillium riverlandense]|uniref:uncharacterized protein n=1 Tax=Penicillium riverlandense TaxID=1903569 RepID=UPI002549926B|nr:uncharacterized protein N7474_005093 [Penicillium riverlandense]KAJ5819502.1 hypothetical protein N7474_005093 [Penicillium riverlandense]